MSSEQLTPQQVATKLFMGTAMENSKDLGAVVVIYIRKDGSVEQMGQSKMIQPKGLIGYIAQKCAEFAAAAMAAAMEAGELCNCPKCIADRGAVVSTHGPKAEA